MSVGPDVFSRGSMPEVSLTPLVRVSLMCTPSRIPLAAKVGPISETISASEGGAAKASACAERRSRARCSSSAKIRPPVSRSPSQTAPPPCTAESNGDTPAWSRWLSVPPTLTMRSRLRSSNFCSMRGLLESAGSVRYIDLDHIFPHFFVVREALLKQRLEGLVKRRPRRHRPGSPGRRGRGESRGPPYAVVPVRRPDAVAVARSWRPAQHRGAERHVERCAQRPQPRLGRREQVARVDDRTAEFLEQPRLLPQPEVVKRRRGADPRVRGQQRARVPDQERVPERRERRQVDGRQDVMRHVLRVRDGRAGQERVARKSAQHLLPGRRLAGDHLVPAWVVEAGRRQVKGVKRLIDHHSVRPVLPGAHHRRGDRSRPRPHRDPRDAGAGAGTGSVQKTTTLLSTSPCSILAKAASTSPSPIVSETNFSSGSRPSRCRSTSIGKSRLGRQSPYQEDLSAPPRPNTSSNGSSSCISGVGTPTSTTTPARSRAKNACL